MPIPDDVINNANDVTPGVATARREAGCIGLLDAGGGDCNTSDGSRGTVQW